MELEDLKNSWQSLNDRLNKQQLLHENMVLAIIKSKAGGALNRLSNYEWFGLVLIVLVLPFLLMFTNDNFSIIQSIFVYILKGILVFSFCCQIWKIWMLSKIDFNKDVAFNARLVNRFNIHIKREKIQGYLVLSLALLFVLYTIWDQPNVGKERIVIVVVALVVGFIWILWQYKKFYKRNIGVITKSLEELEEWKEQNDK